MLRCINIYMDREDIIAEISQGSPWDDTHIRRCLDIVDGEPDDVVRIYARLWLERNSIVLAKRLLGS